MLEIQKEFMRHGAVSSVKTRIEVQMCFGKDVEGLETILNFVTCYNNYESKYNRSLFFTECLNRSFAPTTTKRPKTETEPETTDENNIDFKKARSNIALWWFDCIIGPMQYFVELFGQNLRNEITKLKQKGFQFYKYKDDKTKKYSIDEILSYIHLPSDYANLSDYFNLSKSQMFAWLKKYIFSSKSTLNPRPLFNSLLDSEASSLYSFIWPSCCYKRLICIQK